MPSCRGSGPLRGVCRLLKARGALGVGIWGGNLGAALAPGGSYRYSLPRITPWCNWQHNWFWSSHFRFESWRGNHNQRPSLSRIIPDRGAGCFFVASADSADRTADPTAARGTGRGMRGKPVERGSLRGCAQFWASGLVPAVKPTIPGSSSATREGGCPNARGRAGRRLSFRSSGGLATACCALAHPNHKDYASPDPSPRFPERLRARCVFRQRPGPGTRPSSVRGQRGSG